MFGWLFMLVRACHVRMVVHVARLVHGSAIGKISNIVAKHQLTIGLLRLGVVEWWGTCIGSSRSLLLPIERRCLYGRLTRVTKLLLPSRIDLVRILLERQEGTFDLLMRLCVLYNAI